MKMTDLNQNKKRILFFITGLNKSGAETQLYYLLTKLSKREDITIRVIAIIDGYYKEKIENLGIEVKTLGTKKKLNILSYISFFKKNVKEFKPDIVHSFLFHSNIISKTSLYFMKKNFKLICSYRDIITNHKTIKILEKINIKSCDLFISNSEEAKNALNIYKIPKKQNIVINNGFFKKRKDQNRIEELKRKYKNKNVIITVANFRKQKDYDTNLMTAYYLKTRLDMKNFVFIYIGNGEEKDRIKRKTKQLKLDREVKFLGKRDDVLELLSISDVYFMPTLHESQSNSLIEAMYTKTPIVTTNIKENTDLVKNAYFTDIKDIESMAIKIKDIIENGFDKEKLEENKNIVKENFDLSNMEQKYYKVYEDILK